MNKFFLLVTMLGMGCAQPAVNEASQAGDDAGIAADEEKSYSLNRSFKATHTNGQFVVRCAPQTAWNFVGSAELRGSNGGTWSSSTFYDGSIMKVRITYRNARGKTANYRLWTEGCEQVSSSESSL